MSQIVLTSDTLASPATAGAIEYTSPVIYATPVGVQRGLIPNLQFYRLDSAYAGANATGAQGVFGVGTGGTGIGVTLSSSTVYAFESRIALSKSAGATAHTIGLGYGGTATLNNIATWNDATQSTTSFTNLTPIAGVGNLDSTFVNSASNTQITASVAAASSFVWIKITGTVSINAGGTFVPQYTLSAAPGGAYSTVAGSYFYIYPIGASGAAINVGTWS